MDIPRAIEIFMEPGRIDIDTALEINEESRKYNRENIEARNIALFCMRVVQYQNDLDAIAERRSKLKNYLLVSHKWEKILRI